MSAGYWKKWPVPLTFTEPGDEATGVIVATDDSEKWPVLHIQQSDGIIRVVRVTQARLHELLGEKAPDVGDKVRIRYIGPAAKAAPGMSPAKEFTVEVRRRNSRPPDGTDTGISGETKQPENVPGAGEQNHE